MKRKLTWLAIAILAAGAFLESFSNYHLVSAIQPLFHYSVCAVGICCCCWLVLQLYSGGGRWHKILGITIVLPFGANLGLMLFDGVAGQMIILKELALEKHAAKMSEYSVLDVRGSRKGREPYAAILSLSSFNRQARIPITQAQYQEYVGFHSGKLCMRLLTFTSPSGAVWVAGEDTEQVQKSFSVSCSI